MKMKINRRKLLSMLGTSPVLLAGASVEAATKKKSVRSGDSAEKVTAVSPKGTPPPVQRYSMAPRLDTLKGKTIYLVDTSFFGGGLLLHQMQDWFQENMPDVKTVFRKKAGGPQTTRHSGRRSRQKATR